MLSTEVKAINCIVRKMQSFAFHSRTYAIVQVDEQSEDVMGQNSLGELFLLDLNVNFTIKLTCPHALINLHTYWRMSQVCYQFQRGECTRGDGCRFSHETGGDSGFAPRKTGTCYAFQRGT